MATSTPIRLPDKESQAIHPTQELSGQALSGVIATNLAMPDQWKIRNRMMRTGTGTPSSQNKPYFIRSSNDGRAEDVRLTSPAGRAPTKNTRDRDARSLAIASSTSYFRSKQHRARGKTEIASLMTVQPVCAVLNSFEIATLLSPQHGRHFRDKERDGIAESPSIATIHIGRQLCNLRKIHWVQTFAPNRSMYSIDIWRRRSICMPR